MLGGLAEGLWRCASQLWKVDVCASEVGHRREGGGQLPSVDHLRVLGRPTQGVWSVTVIAREMMCMTIKLANISREVVSYPSVSYLRVLGRPAQGVWPVKVRARDFDVYD